MPVRAVVERGPEDKRSVAFAIHWPGWSRGAKTADSALDTLESYRDRYRPVAHLAGTLPFLIRHSASRTLDDAWEMEDKDLSAQNPA